jgi:hypothetical protein
VRQWRIAAAADRTAPEPFTHCRVSRREQVAALQSHRRHRPCGGAPGGPAVGDLFAAWGAERVNPPCPWNHPRRRRHRQHTRRKPDFPRRRTGEPIPDRPVSRRYDHVEDTLADPNQAGRKTCTWRRGRVANEFSLPSARRDRPARTDCSGQARSNAVDGRWPLRAHRSAPARRRDASAMAPSWDRCPRLSGMR